MEAGLFLDSIEVSASYLVYIKNSVESRINKKDFLPCRLNYIDNQNAKKERYDFQENCFSR